MSMDILRGVKIVLTEIQPVGVYSVSGDKICLYWS